VPNTINTPLLTNNGEIQVALNAGLSGFDPQATYAISDNIGVMLNGSFADRTSDSSDNFHKHRFLEIAPGYYQTIGNSGRFEVFGGYGFGRLQAEYESLWMSRSDVNSNRIFLQPTIGAVTDIFDGSLSTRFVLVTLHEDDTRNSGLFFEPVLTGKLGYKNIKGIMQFGLSLPLNSDEIQFEFQPLLFSIGLQFTINRNFNK